MLPACDLEIVRKELGREPNTLEIACFDNLWSEHCSYRSTRHLLKTLPTSGPDVILGPGDDAAIVKLSENWALAVSMESHNHPSYVVPYDGAATGVGGIVRDVLSMGARPIALMDPLYFGPVGKEKNRYLIEHIVAGISGYGNCIGVPVVRGDIAFDDGYTGNPLVNVVCIGVVKPDRFITARAKKPGNHLFLYGASTGRDGLGGASFASRDLSEDSEAADRPSVQLGDPYTEKLLIEATLEMAETGKVLSCRDLGAAGLAGASSEMCSTFGGVIHADRVHQREPGMKPVEIMLAESQERMIMEVAPEDIPDMARIAGKFDLLWSDIGEIIKEPRYRVKFHGELVCDLPIGLLVGGTPACIWEKRPYDAVTPYSRPSGGSRDLILQVLSHPEVADKRWIFEQYDHDVQIRTVRLAGDAAVLRIGDSFIACSCGCNPRQIRLSPCSGTANAVIENAANLACVGSDPLCLVNCLNFASPVHPEVYWELEQCVLGLGLMAREMKIPVVGGNVSLYNESDEYSTRINPTPSIAMIGKDAYPSGAFCEGYDLALIGDTGPHLGGSILDACTSCGGFPPPIGDPSTVRAIRELVSSGHILSATDLSQGGLAAAATSLG
ncbi:MAG: phosphoribosylformylglycinamidine synthase subunit PurL, partial [Methanoregulaceae archaeon]|nr:phosphoribosylformylglycinamidine synthase subunit PurL [Methanoregulaceae archaeon]